ncbi:beta-ketoacyl synthase N-terminal-like domain-containing protein [Xenorhabdus bovienii]|uniref:Beta-ketoacyl synthase-like N-terminal domain-containing protein n=1 Tax=Xenorhabdus bovienii TaxID=40576 RepID=A0A0B6XGA9_XENBV|nr:beta-ketoacyl synthase N-terminal-like domain-containing protein [Xenorhabdus bovienii]CDM92108.1 protein of unknown function [Xenorhabdus bovienii]
MGIYIASGVSLLPDGLNMDNLIQGNIAAAERSDSSLHLPNIIGERLISDKAFVMPRMDKIVRRVANAQSRWVLYSGIKTWESSTGDKISPEQRGLFIGLGTSDADDDILPIAFDAQDDESYVSRALVETPPLMGLALLNTSTASHLSQHLNIQGDNGFFSPHVDAGGNALLEGYYSIKEKRSQWVLCGGGSQKISPWYYLAYERLIKNTPWLPAEAAAFITLHEDVHNADGEILRFERSFLHNTAFHNNNPYQRFLTELTEENLSPCQIIHVGKATDGFIALASDTFPDAIQFYLDKTMGYSGPAAPFIAINLAIDMHKKGISVDNVNRNFIRPLPPSLVLVVVHGLENQCIAILLRMGMPKEGEL